MCWSGDDTPPLGYKKRCRSKTYFCGNVTMLKAVYYFLLILWLCCISVTAKYFSQYLAYEKSFEELIAAFYGQVFVFLPLAVVLYFCKKDTFSSSAVGKFQMIAKIIISICNISVIGFFSFMLATEDVHNDGLILIPLLIILLAVNTLFLYGNKNTSIFECWPFIIIKRKTLEERRKLEELEKK